MRTTIKMLLLSTLLTIACCAFGTQDQKPVYDPVAQKLNWTVTEDTTSQMVSCNSQIPPVCTPFWHTSNIQLSVTNKRTGVTVTAHAGNTGAIATATLSIAALPGDEFNYSEQDQIFCPAGGIWLGLVTGGQLEIAYTLAQYTGGPRGQCSTVGTTIWCAYPVRNWCTGDTTPPDNSFDGAYINDKSVHSYWQAFAVCFRLGSSGPWACSNGVAVGSDAILSPGHCTKASNY